MLLATALMATLAGCGKPPEPVDPVPSVEDVNNIVVNGKPMAPIEFLDGYCMTSDLQANHPVCVQVLRAMDRQTLGSPAEWRRF